MKERISPREQLINDYNEYVDKMLKGDVKTFRVLLKNDNGETIEDTTMMAHNRSHCFIEATNMFMIENMNVGTIDIKEEK